MTVEAKQTREISRLLQAAQRLGAGVRFVLFFFSKKPFENKRYDDIKTNNDTSGVLDLPMSLTEIQRLQKRVRKLEKAQDQHSRVAFVDWNGGPANFWIDPNTTVFEPLFPGYIYKYHILTRCLHYLHIFCFLS